MRASRRQIEASLADKDVFEGIDIKEVTKEAKIGWLKSLLIAAVWPLLKSVLLKKINPKIVDIIDDILMGF